MVSLASLRRSKYPLLTLFKVQQHMKAIDETVTRLDGKFKGSLSELPLSRST
jgi:hypothetical protein